MLDSFPGVNTVPVLPKWASYCDQTPLGAPLRGTPLPFVLRADILDWSLDFLVRPRSVMKPPSSSGKGPCGGVLDSLAGSQGAKEPWRSTLGHL